MKFQLGPEIISSYKRLSYKAWYALAEFIDNSTQAYFDNKETLDKLFIVEKTRLTVKIELKKDTRGDYLEIWDNSIGMSEQELQQAVIVGKPPKKKKGRSKYGIGLKTAACWFGDKWCIKTKKAGDENEITVQIDVTKIAKGQLNLNPQFTKKNKQDHYTIIQIWILHRNIRGRLSSKIKDYLRSFYRRDINKGLLELWCFKTKLEWDYADLKKQLIKNKDGSLVEKDFSFKINKKLVKCWAGVLDKGSRANAGFSIIQSDRVIKGWPDSYRPSTIFGSQEGGRNDLINQRLFGEIELNGFDVSHTKDEILFDDDELELLEAKLEDELSDLKMRALTHRKFGADERVPTNQATRLALTEFSREIKSSELFDIVNTLEIPSKEIIRESNLILRKKIEKENIPSLKAKIGEIDVNLYLVENLSPNDPYVVIESTQSKSRIIVIINMAHPHWSQLKSQDSILNFIRHCAYDGVAEWKTYFKIGMIDPDTVKLIKDNLLRVPFEMEKHYKKNY
jgi:hypothetical protein